MIAPQTENDAEIISPYEQQTWDWVERTPTAPLNPQQPPTQPTPLTPPTPPTRKKTGGGFRAWAIGALAVVLLLIFGIGLFAGWEFSRTTTATGNTGSASATTTTTTSTQSAASIQAEQEAVIAKDKAAVVEIDVTTQSGNAIGSGDIIDARGYIVTNNHVVSGAQNIEVVLSDGTHLPAQVVGTAPANDLAILKINTTKPLTVITLGNSSQLQVGEYVLAIGNPLGITETVTEGIVSATGRTVSEGQGGATLTNAIQTDAALNPGNSGGALIDLQGNLVGIPTLGAVDPEFNTPANGVSFAIPANTVASVASQFIPNFHA
ncbi:MAG TPA: trypsin-like peptidase domain-containing protein [Ktedonobacteraceae bacterium]|nr:trypsin-like peptidase domain-containing protein [Ktedonobacteraceae bacterium]